MLPFKGATPKPLIGRMLNTLPGIIESFVCTLRCHTAAAAVLLVCLWVHRMARPAATQGTTCRKARSVFTRHSVRVAYVQKMLLKNVHTVCVLFCCLWWCVSGRSASADTDVGASYCGRQADARSIRPSHRQFTGRHLR